MYSLPLDTFLGDGLSYASRGALSLYVDILSDANCIAQRVYHAWAGGECLIFEIVGFRLIFLGASYVSANI